MNKKPAKNILRNYQFQLFKKGFLQNINAKRYKKIIIPYCKVDMLNRKFLNVRTSYLNEKSLPVLRKSKCENKK